MAFIKKGTKNIHYLYFPIQTSNTLSFKGYNSSNHSQFSGYI